MPGVYGEPEHSRAGQLAGCVQTDYKPLNEAKKDGARILSSPGAVILGIETSCDETAAAIVTGDRTIMANVVRAQIEEHRPFGGVVPEIAARSHVEVLDHLIAHALQEAGLEFADLNAVAATAGPGLIGGVMVGLTTAKAICLVTQKPLIAVNHLEAHALTPRLTDQVDFPYVLLLVSGGHCQLLVVQGVGRYRRLGTTIDDAIGEAFDKTARLLGLPYPGGPALEQAATGGDPERHAFPRPLLGRDGCDFSFSGLKTAVRAVIDEKKPKPASQALSDIAASFQSAVGDVLADRVGHALALAAEENIPVTCLVMAGGVAANHALRNRVGSAAAEHGLPLIAPPIGLCTDNAAMVAWAGVERMRIGDTDALDFAARPRWPLDQSAPSAVGAGRKGAKA